MKIEWTHCLTYEDAKDFSGAIYLHEWNGTPYYWGMAHNSFFGGGKRTLDGLTAQGRYNPGYAHWIDGSLSQGARLYLGKLDEEALKRIKEVKDFLIVRYGHVKNKRFNKETPDLQLQHTGEVPESITRLE